MNRTLTRRRSGLYPDLKSFEVAPRARLEPVRLRRVDLTIPELTACGKAPGFLVAMWMTPLSSWMLIVCERRRECPIVAGEFTDWYTLELARPEYLCEWMLSKLALRKYERQPDAYMKREITYSLLREEGTLREPFHNVGVVFLGNISTSLALIRRTTYADEQPLEISGHGRSSASLTVVAGCG